MSLKITETYATVFEIHKEEKFAKANLSTSRKGLSKDGTDNWVNSSWKARFVGDAFKKIDEISDKSRIKIVSALISNEPYYNADNEKKYFVGVTVFDFEVADSSNKKSNDDDVDDDDAPF